MATKLTKSFHRNGALLIGALLGCSSCQHARSLTVDGVVSLDGGDPVVGGVVVITELAGNFVSMPDINGLTEVKTGEDGSFNAQVKHRGGDLNISLDPEPCKWGVAYVKLSGDDLSSRSQVTVHLKAQRDKRSTCQQINGTPLTATGTIKPVP